jgi:hypothetical protein
VALDFLLVTHSAEYLSDSPGRAHDLHQKKKEASLLRCTYLQGSSAHPVRYPTGTCLKLPFQDGDQSTHSSTS